MIFLRALNFFFICYNLRYVFLSFEFIKDIHSILFHSICFVPRKRKSLPYIFSKFIPLNADTPSTTTTTTTTTTSFICMSIKIKACCCCMSVLKGQVHGSAHAHLSKCCFSARTCCIVYESNMIMSECCQRSNLHTSLAVTCT